METALLLQRLCDFPAVSGFEIAAAQSTAELFAPFCDDTQIDHQGNLLAFRRCGRQNAKTILLDAHLDQIGFLVTEVLDGGFLRFTPVGGIDPRMLLGSEVTILTDKPLYGVISCMPPHLLKAGEQNKAVPIDQMTIDTGFIDAKGKVPIGTPVVWAQPPVRLLGDRFASRCLDDRAGVAVLLLTMEKLQQENNLACDIAVLVSAQEEVTGLGAQSGTFFVQPDYAIAVDVTHGKTYDSASDYTFALGDGVAIGMGPNFHRDLTQALIRTAKAYDIPYALEVMEGNTGTNAWTIQIIAHGVATALLSIPERYMHTPIETVSLGDIESAAQLLYEFIRRFTGEALV